MRHRALPWLVLLLMAELTFGLACGVVPVPGARTSSAGDTSVAGRILAASQAGFGERAIDQADTYLHRGVEHVRNEAFRGTWFHQMGTRVGMQGVMHREGKDAAEVVPWLWFGTRLDPENVDYPLLSAYWLKIAGRDDLAMGVVREALGRHPRDPRLHLERARLLLRAGSIAEATRALDAGLTCAATTQFREGDVTAKTLCTYRSLVFEYEGNTNAAIACLAAWEKDSQGINDRMADFRNGRTPAIPATAMLSNLVNTAHQCDKHGDHGHSEERTDTPAHQ